MQKTTLSFHYSTLIVFCQVLMLIFTVIDPVNVHAEGSESALSSDQLGAISMGCTSIKTSLRQLQRADSATRAHLGTTYQAILDRYLTPMNLRLVKNNQLGDNLNSLLTTFNSERQHFNQNFITYSRSLEELLNTNCKENPNDFYTKLIETRATRANLAQSVTDLANTLEQHLAAVEELKNV